MMILVLLKGAGGINMFTVDSNNNTHCAITLHCLTHTSQCNDTPLQINHSNTDRQIYAGLIYPCDCSYPDPSLGLLMRSTQCVTVFCQHFPQLNFDFVGVNGPFTKNPGLDHWCIRVPRRQASPLAKRIARPNVTSGGGKFGGQDLKMMT